MDLRVCGKGRECMEHFIEDCEIIKDWFIEIGKNKEEILEKLWDKELDGSKGRVLRKLWKEKKRVISRSNREDEEEVK